jgi:hypothetical protein
MLNLPLPPLYHNYISIYPHKTAMKVHVSCLNLEKKNISSQFSSKKSAVLQALLHGTHGVAEVVHAQLFKARTGQGAAWTFWRKPRSRDPGLGRSIHWIGLFGCLFGKILPGNQSVFAMKKPWGCPDKTLPETNRHDLRRNHQV